MKAKTLVNGINAVILMMIIGHSLLLPDTTYGQVQGCVKNQQNEALPCVRISSADGSAVCSDPSGRYTLEAEGGKPLIFRKKGYTIKRITVPLNEDNQTIPDVHLAKGSPENEIAGFAGGKKEGITIKLFKLTGSVYSSTPVDKVKTCADGVYAFSDLAAGTYKVMPDCSVCNFRPRYHDGIVIPAPGNENQATQSPATREYNFITSCDPGECH